MLVKILLVIAAFFLGFFVACWNWARKKIGVLRRLSDPVEGTYFYLELEKDKMTELENGRYVLLEIREDDRVIRFPQK